MANLHMAQSNRREKKAGMMACLMLLLLPVYALPTSPDRFSTIASWYGPGFQGRKTASGGRFDTEQLTAASLTLPFGTKVTVKNPKNGRTVDVVITDRGPYVHGRGIDLSHAAAHRLGIDGIGTVICSINNSAKQTYESQLVQNELIASSQTTEPWHAARMSTQKPIHARSHLHHANNSFILVAYDSDAGTIPDRTIADSYAPHRIANLPLHHSKSSLIAYHPHSSRLSQHHLTIKDNATASSYPLTVVQTHSGHSNLMTKYDRFDSPYNNSQSNLAYTGGRRQGLVRAAATKVVHAYRGLKSVILAVL